MIYNFSSKKHSNSGGYEKFCSWVQPCRPELTNSYLNLATARINFALLSYIHINEHTMGLKISDIKGPDIFDEMIQLKSLQINIIKYSFCYTLKLTSTNIDRKKTY